MRTYHSYTWFNPMVVIKSLPWGTGHWFVFKVSLCTCTLHMHERYLFFRLILNQLYLSINPQTHQSHYLEGQHPNGTSDYKDNTKLASKMFKKSMCVPQHICQLTRLFLNNNLFIQRSWKGHISFPVTIKSLHQERKVYLGRDKIIV